MSQIFISYSRSDKSIVDEFINQLESAGHPVWVDREGIRGGEQWRRSVQHRGSNTDRRHAERQLGRQLW